MWLIVIFFYLTLPLGSEHVFTDIKDYYRRQYFEAIDAIVKKIKIGFEQKIVIIIRQCEEFLVKTLKATTKIDVSVEGIQHFKKELNLTMLRPKFFLFRYLVRQKMYNLDDVKDFLLSNDTEQNL